MVKRINGKYVVYDSTGKKRLGTHDTKAEADDQIAAIEASKARRHKQ